MAAVAGVGRLRGGLLVAGVRPARAVVDARGLWFPVWERERSRRRALGSRRRTGADHSAGYHRAGAHRCGGGGGHGPGAGARYPLRDAARRRLDDRSGAGPSDSRLPGAHGGGLHANRLDRGALRLAAGGEPPRRLPLAGGESVRLRRRWATVGGYRASLRAAQRGSVWLLRPEGCLLRVSGERCLLLRCEVGPRVRGGDDQDTGGDPGPPVGHTARALRRGAAGGADCRDCLGEPPGALQPRPGHGLRGFSEGSYCLLAGDSEEGSIPRMEVHE